MGDFVKGLLDKAPDIIRAAAERPLGVAALIVLVLGAVVVLLFRNAAGKWKVLALGVITAGLLGFMAWVLVPPSDPAPGNQAATKYAGAYSLYMAGQYDQARAAFGEALSLFTQVDDRDGQANTLSWLGNLERKLGRNDQAHADYEGALRRFKQEDNRPGQADMLSRLGDLEHTLGRNDQARAAFGEALALYKQEDDRPNQANVFSLLGQLEGKLGRNDHARAAYGEALALYREEDNRRGQADVLSRLAELERTPGQPQPGKSSPEQTAIQPPPGKSSPEKKALVLQAVTKFTDAMRLHKGGQYDQARVAYGEALTLYKQADNRPGQALMLSMLGELDSRKSPQQAARYFFEAAQLYEMIGWTKEHDAALRQADAVYKK